MRIEDQKEVNQFFNNMTDVFVKSLTMGFPQIEINDIKLENELLNTYFFTGCKYIQNGIEPKVIEILMESLLLKIIKQGKDLEEIEIFQLVLSKKVLELLQNHRVKEYLDYQSYLVTYPDKHYNELKLLNFS